MTTDEKLLARIEDSGFSVLLLRAYQDAILAFDELPPTEARSRIWRRIAEDLLAEGS